MEKIKILEVREGMVLSEPITASDGKVIFEEGMQLTNENIEMLKTLGVSDVSVYRNIIGKYEVPEDIINMVREEARQAIEVFIDRYFTSNRQDMAKVKKTVSNIVNEIISVKEIVAILYRLKNHDEYTFTHSINVCLYSISTAMVLLYDEQMLMELGIGAILHDIGKLRIPKSILAKPGSLTVEEFNDIKKHSTFGYEMLSDWKYNKISPANIALKHHERCDGTGYPNQLTFGDIDESVRIVMIADVYDALTSNRVYRQKQSPDVVMSYINDLGVNQFDKSIVNSFKKCISIYPVGTGIILNTGEKALVLKVNMDMPTRPVIRLLYDSDGTKIDEYKEKDLTKEWDIFIIDSYDL